MTSLTTSGLYLPMVGAGAAITTGVPDAAVYGKITFDAQFDHNQSLQAVYSVPAGYSALLIEHHYAIPASLPAEYVQETVPDCRPRPQVTGRSPGTGHSLSAGTRRRTMM